MKRYFKNLWLAILNKKAPSGLDANTWYRVYEIIDGRERPYLAEESIKGSYVYTDTFGHITPFITHTNKYTWI